ncbi:MAG TPA: hypothetical protein VES19_05630 [Candidatus Limnocylindrales bacterium]|nr:hypothetical protein [Candidatus Limnocylindrales bacterium]
MTRLLAILISIVLLAAPSMPVAASSAASPNTAATVLPPDTPAVAPAVEVPAPADLTRVGRLTIKGIGLNVNVYRWSCDGSDLPNRALRWGCTGANNQFIVGHAYGVFRPYYLAWKYKRFKIGMVATFTKPSGAVIRYRLAWVRKVPKSYIYNGQTGDVWAYGPTSTPSITLQTCWGATNLYRIVARWVKI